MPVQLRGIALQDHINNTKAAFAKANIHNVTRKNVVMRFLTAQLFPDGAPGENEHRLATLFDETETAPASSQARVRDFSVDREQLCESELRFSETYCLDLIIGSVQAPNGLKDAFYEHEDRLAILRSMGVSLDDATKIPDDELVDILTCDYEIGGFLVKVETPVPTRFCEEEGELSRHSFSYSWGMYTSTWLYHPSSMTEILAAAEAWREKVLDDEYALACKKRDEA